MEKWSQGLFPGQLTLPPTPKQELKLRLLTLHSLASEPHILTYEDLNSTLGLPSPATLETLITEAISNGLISAPLSPTSIPKAVA
jgi:COP9 signalosome complex subunit 7